MAYQSKHTGSAIDAGIDINTTQNTKIATLETKTTTLETNVSKLNTSIYNSGSTNQYLTKAANNTVEWKTLVTPTISILQNQTISESAWVSDTTYEDFPFRASISASGCTAQTGGQVIFSVSDATAGIFAPVGQTASNVIYIYANEKVNVTIPTILLFKE